MHPRRYEVLKKLVEQARGSRQELIQRISNDISQRLDNVGITNRIWGREKHLYKIYQKCARKIRNSIPLWIFMLSVSL